MVAGMICPPVPTTEPPPKIVQFRLNGNGVIAPVHRAVRDSIEVLGIALNALAGTDFANVPRVPGSMMAFGLTSSEPVDFEERRTAYTNWLLSKAFQDLARSINEALQEAYFYVEVLNLQGGESTWGDLMETFRDIRRRANQMNFPDLLRAVSTRLKTPLQFADEYNSLQKVRNCLEHRAGVVGERDLDADRNLKLRFPTFEVVIKNGDKEIVVAEQKEIFLEAGGSIGFRIGRIEKEYKLGERVLLTPHEFQRIAQGCMSFCTDLSSKLPERLLAVPQ